jgi:hypothetical protein
MAGVWRKLYEERFKMVCLSSNVTKIIKQRIEISGTCIVRRQTENSNKIKSRKSVRKKEIGKNQWIS